MEIGWLKLRQINGRHETTRLSTVLLFNRMKAGRSAVNTAPKRQRKRKAKW